MNEHIAEQISSATSELSNCTMELVQLVTDVFFWDALHNAAQYKTHLVAEKANCVLWKAVLGSAWPSKLTDLWLTGLFPAEVFW